MPEFVSAGIVYPNFRKRQNVAVRAGFGPQSFVSWDM